MRGSGMDNRPFGQPPAMLGRGQPNLITQQQQQQQQQMMMIQQQQFMARQQVIQREQLQKQRQLRQEEEKQAGIMAAIRNLQQKTIQQQLHQQPPSHAPDLPPQRPPNHPHPYNHPPRGMSSPINSAQAPNMPPYRHDSIRPGDPLSRGAQQTNMAPPGLNLNGSFSENTAAPPPPINHFSCPPPNIPPASRLHVPPPFSPMNPSPLPTSYQFNGTQHRPPLLTPGTNVGGHNPGIPNNALLDTKNNSFVCQPPGFDRIGHAIHPGSTNDGSIHQRSQFGQFENTYNSPPPSIHGPVPENSVIKTSRPPLLDIPGKISILGMPATSLDRTHVPDISPKMWQKSSHSNSWPISSKDQDGYKEHNSGHILTKEVVRGDRLDFSSSKSREDKSDRHYSDFRSNRDKAGPRNTNQVRDRSSPHRGASRRQDSADDRHSSGSRMRNEPRHSEDRRSHSRSYDKSRVPEYKSRRHVGDRSPSNVDSRARNRSHSRDRNRSQRTSRERSLSTSRYSVSSTRSDYYSRSKTSATRQSSPQTNRDSSSGRRERISKRSRSPSSEQSYSGQLSQYRQDLLNSENKNRDQNSLSPKRRKLDIDIDDDFDVSKDEELQLEAASGIIYFTRSCPADLFFSKNPDTGDMEASARMIELENRFEEEIVRRAEKVRATQVTAEEPPQVQPAQQNHHHHHHHCSGHKSSSCDSSSDGEDNDDDDDDDDSSCSQIMEEWDKRKKHPFSLHPELWFNLKGQANDGPLCRCSIKSRQAGIRHEIYPGEKPIDLCEDETSNLHKLYHYRITMSPYTNFLTKVPTLINHDNHEYIFEGFSMFSHVKLENIPPCKLLRFNIEYTIHFIPESAPENFTVRSLSLFNRFIFTEVLELVDVDWTGPLGGCQRFHFLPRFCRTLPDSGCKEVLSMNTVLSFLLKSVKPLVDESRLEEIMQCGESEWHARVDNLRGMIVTNPGMRPSSIRVDQLDRKVTTPVMVTDNFDDSSDEKKKVAKRTKTDVETGKEEKEEGDRQPKYPLIIHQGYRPAQLSYAGDPVYRKAWKQYVKFRHLLNSKPKILAADKLKLKDQEEKLREIRMKKTMKREVTVELSSKGFMCTGLRADLCQHALMVPVLMSHLRFHICLDVLEETLDYKFEDRNLLQLSLTHTSYRTNYGTNPDHTRNSLTNCGMRQVEYGDRRIHYQNTRKRGICILVDIMSRFGKQEETASEIPHNERLEFLGDAVIEFLTSVHLFYMFPWLEEGGLTTYRMALVQNQHLAILAKKLKLQDFMLYVHGPDLCHESDLRHAMANCCEAIMGALFMDGGLDVVDRIFSRALFDDEDILLRTWSDLPKHVLQQEEPGGDRHWVKSSPILQKMEKFEERIGIKFNHIRILAKAFTHRNIGINPLTLGHNQRLEFLGDTVLQLVASEYLYKHYPEHHEGHLSLLRSSLVNSRTQGLVYDDLGMSEFVICNENAVNEGLDMKTKQRADILESFVGALFVDKDLDYCRSFCNVCFFPRLKDFILNQDWNDPKSQLQQCCLTLREVGGGEPDIPIYKVIKSIGPTNTRKYVVAVYFRGKRLARGTGHSIQQAEMAAATQALKKRAELFPILQHQRRFLERIKKDDSERDSDKEDVSSYRKLKQPWSSQRRRTTVRSRQK